MSSFIRNRTILRLYETIAPALKYSLHVEDSLAGDSALILAPHGDDEVIGCGGALLRHTAAGGRARALICTSDGHVREGEARAASRLMKLDEPLFLNYPVESLERQAGLPDELARVLDNVMPQVVFVPFFIDNHTDHRALNKALLAACAKKDYKFIVYAYPVWLPLYPNVLIDIGGVWEQKKAAIGSYQSQLATRDYITMSRSLAAYWATVKGHGLELAETFFKMSCREYASLGKKLL